MEQRAKGKEEREKKKEKRETHYPSDVLDKEARKKGHTWYIELIKRNKYEGQAGKIIHDVILKVEVFAGQHLSKMGESQFGRGGIVLLSLSVRPKAFPKSFPMAV
jgi:hypothetical protein